MDLLQEDVVHYSRFNDAAEAILQLARRVVGPRTFFVSYTNEQTFSVLSALNQCAMAMVGGSSNSLERSCGRLVFAGCEPVAIPDTALDPRGEEFAPMNIRGYFGVPIILGDGRTFGTFCAVDSVPMELDAEQRTSMTSLAMLIAYAIDLERLATHDTLTGLYNRTLFDDRLRLEMARADRGGSYIAVAYIDLDRFSPINEASSYKVGDDILARVGLRLRSTVRRGDTAARIGGVKFGLVLPDIRGLDDAGRVAETLLESMQDPIRVGGKEFTITASIGVAVYPLHGEDPKTLMVSVDTALNAARTAGGDSYRISASDDVVNQGQPASDRPLLRVLSNPKQHGK